MIRTPMVSNRNTIFERAVSFAWVAVFGCVGSLTLVNIGIAVPLYADDDPFGIPSSSAASADPFASPAAEPSSPVNNDATDGSPDATTSDAMKTLEEKQISRRSDFKQSAQDAIQRPNGQTISRMIHHAEKLLAELEKIENEMATRNAYHEAVLDSQREHFAELADSRAALEEELHQLRADQRRGFDFEDRTAENRQLLNHWLANQIRKPSTTDSRQAILDLLESEPDLSRDLVLASSGRLDNSNPLLLSLTRVAKQPESQSMAEQAVRVVRRVSREAAYQTGLENRPTDPWPIVTQRQHTTTRDLLVQLNHLSSYDFIEVPLQEGLSYIEFDFDISMVIDRQSIEKKGIDLDLLIDFSADDLTIRSTLNEILTPQGLGFYVENDRIRITTIDEARNRMLRRVYDIARLLKASNLGTTDDIIEAIKDTISQASTGEVHDPPRVNLTAIGTRLIVVANESDQHEIAVLLRSLDDSQSD
ncbi:hypothetical protein [Aporhodopirellula aestuarii]|uniref:Uncharacterized protein n=1 Tax=Aporhodopirellula aestuarii TaxID=2950107 RepID=A0ABT0U7M4_9BACT|nr:hypothetical protein [Aporhodopirellula aestuarii]MCM2372935.1 hypothetical protein [Aporhodopirellula aestuarii]